MSKQRIFELIRKEEAALFAGAGMSMYAGYPSGAKLAEILFKNLTSDLQEQVDFTTNLPKLAEDIYYIKGCNKNYLIETLKKEFQKEPISTETHQLLAKIPQIKTIITTNYDTLFETTNKNIQVIRKSTDCATTNQKKQCLFKIHGDLTDVSNIILSNSDYNNYFIKDNEKSLLWNNVKTKLIENHIIFIGYAFEDSNILVMIEKILNELGDYHKEMFFVSPKIQSAKLKFLHQKGIEYIQSTAEELIKEINEDLKLNYIPGLNKGIGTADTAFDFAKSYNVDISLTKSKDFYNIEKISSLDGTGNNEIKFEINAKPEKTKKIIDSLNGKDFNNIYLDKDVLKEFGHYFNGIKIMNQDNINSLHLVKVPNIFGLFNIIFEDGFELDNYYIEIFIIKPNENQFKFKIKTPDFDTLITLDFTISSIHFEIEPSKLIKSVKNCLNYYSVLLRITSNLKFKMYKDNKLFYDYSKIISFKNDTFDASFFVNYFDKLKKIEKYFNVNFSNISLDDVDEKNIKYIDAYINKIVMEDEFNGINFKTSNNDEFEYIINNSVVNQVLIISEKEKSVFNLHGIDFTIGYLHKYINDAFINNLEDLKSGATNEIYIESKSKRIFSQFTDEITIIKEH